MSRFKEKLQGIDVFECSYYEWKGHDDLNSLQGEGVAYRFYKWLESYGYDEDIDSVYNNLSGIRDGNRLDIHDNYKLFDSDLEISFLYVVNGNVWAVLLDKPNDSWYGEFELPCV